MLNRQGQALEQREVYGRVERFGLEGGETVSRRGQFLAHRLQVLQAFVELKILEAVAQHFQAQECAALLIHPQRCLFGVGAQHVMTMLDGFQHRFQPAAHSLTQRPGEDLRDLIGAEAQQAQLAGAFEDLVDRETAAEDEIAAVFDLVDRVAPLQVHALGGLGLRTSDR